MRLACGEDVKMMVLASVTFGYLMFRTHLFSPSHNRRLEFYSWPVCRSGLDSCDHQGWGKTGTGTGMGKNVWDKTGTGMS